MQNHYLWRTKFYGIRLFEILIFLTAYVILAYGYHLTLWVNRLGTNPPISDLYNFIEFMSGGGLDYFVKMLLTIPIWWLIFRKWKTLELKYRLLSHLVLLPIFILLFIKIYYAISEILGFGHLTSYGMVWDIYIPALFYLLQFGILHAYDYYHDNQRNLQAKSALKEAALKSELSALKAQLNPHFLYNIFNTISASVPPKQEQTREMIAQLSDLFRYQLKASKLEFVPFSEELAFVKKYLDLEKARFDDRLETSYNIAENTCTYLIPPMLLQPLVENAIKHGISPKIDGGKITIQAHKQGDKLAITIADTGVGLADKTKVWNNGIGITNTQLRLKKGYGSQLHFSDNMPQGLKVTFVI